MKLIGIAGRKRSGKDTAGLALVKCGYEQIRFADPLKDMMRALFKAACSFGNEEFIEGGQKETPLAILCGKTTRFAMQTLGTEWGRSTIGSDIWINIALSRAAGLPAAVITDVRFPNEAEAIKNAGGIIIKIVRSEQPLYLDGADGRSSEALTDTIDGDFLVVNNSNIIALQSKVLAIAAKL